MESSFLGHCYLSVPRIWVLTKAAVWGNWGDSGHQQDWTDLR